MDKLIDIRKTLMALADDARAEELRRFFKTGPGEYGEGDIFIGVGVPATRRVAREYRDLSLEDTLALLKSGIHEERFLALIILIQKFQDGNRDEQETIFRLYLKHTEHINSWDLVDASAEHIVGAFLRGRSRRPLYTLARSGSLWERRIAIISTFHFIKGLDFDDTLKIAEILVSDTQDLIHKAVGWT